MGHRRRHRPGRRGPHGQLWAIQAKAYDPAYRVTKRDVNKFLAESGREVFAYRMLIATTNLIDRIGERTIQDQEKRVSFFRLNDLQAADVDWPASPTGLRPTRPRKPARPHDYQREAINKVIKGFESADRGQLIMACGTGKTLDRVVHPREARPPTHPGAGAVVVAVEADAERVASQLHRRVRLAAGVFRRYGRRSDDDVALEHTSDLGVPVTTDPAEIAAFLRRRSGPRWCSPPTSPRRRSPKRSRWVGCPVRSGRRGRGASLCGSGVFGLRHRPRPEKIKAKRRLFMTATPRYFTGRVLKAAKEADFEIASMDDEAKFGTVFHKLSFGEAIKPRPADRLPGRHRRCR